MSKIVQRYSSAIRSSNMASDPETYQSDSDVLGAMGFASKPWITNKDGSKRKGSPLGAAILRLLMGDNHAVNDVALLMARMLQSKIERDTGDKPKWVQCEDVAKAVLAWHRDGACKACGGLGQVVIPNTTTLKDVCGECDGTGRVIFARHFKPEMLDFARWLSEEVARESAFAGAEAMRCLAPQLEI